MGLLSAQVPDVPEARSEIVPARLARKLAPLFGIAWNDGPFGSRTWICDYNRISLTEIARGAPMPGRGHRPDAADPASPWWLDERAAVTAPGGSLPNEIPNATLNRFGPDTKAAVVLTGANRLLAPVRDAVVSALGLLTAADGLPLPAHLRVAAWAALLLEAFRSQPALVAAAIRARTVQRELLVEWELPSAPSAAVLPLTRSEIGAPRRETGSRSRPDQLEVADSTATLLGVRAPEELVDRLLRQLIAVGTRQSSGHLWLSERAPGQLVVEALVPPTELVDRFVRDVVAVPGNDTTEPVLPAVPAVADLAGLSLPGRRAVVLALLTVLRQVQFDADRRERSRREVVAVLAAVDALAAATLDADDPALAVCRCRVADMTVHTLRHDVRNDIAPALAALQAATERCIALSADGLLDRGAAAEAISSANVEVNVVRRTNARHPASALPSPDELDGWLRRTWAAFGRVLEVDVAPPAPGAPDGRLAAGHHLHNYTSYLASHTDDEADLRAAVELFETVVVPARTGYRDRTGASLPLRQSLQTMSRATSALSRFAVDAGRTDEAIHWASIGRTAILQALGERETTELISESTEPAAHFCLLAVPALLTAVELGVAGAGAADLDRADALLEVAEAWADRVTGGAATSYTRHGELVELRSRITALRRSGPRTRTAARATGPRSG
jgi:hypothetical protein